MRVVLIAPPYPLAEAPSPPLGLTYVAAAFEEAGCDVIMLDYIVSQYRPAKLRKALEDFRPDIIGTNSVTMNFKGAAEILSQAKKFCPGATTIMGGPHVSYAAAETLNNYPDIDLIFIGEGEETIREVVCGSARWADIKGLAFRDGDQIINTGARPLIEDLEQLPLPARHLLPMSRYQALGFPVSIITSRGCPNKCIFCLGRKMVGYKVRYRDPISVVDEIEHILAYGIDRINIADDLFTANKARVKAFCSEILRRGLKFSWSAFSRVNTINEEILQIMMAAGCDSISFGIESGNSEMLKVVRKGITLDQAREAIRCCKQLDINAHASFIVGLPGENRQTLQDSRAFAAELDIAHGYHFLAPFPGTCILDNIHDYDLEILTDDYNRYDANQPIVQTSQLSAAEMAAFVESCEAVQKAEWAEVEQRYAQGLASEREVMMVEGYARMQLIFDILSQDLIEDSAPLSLNELCRRVAAETDNEKNFVQITIQSLIDKGFIKDSPDGWFWTHNNQRDYLEKRPAE